MDNSIGFLIYLTTFRLAIIVTGALSIYLGYKLFVLGILPEGNSETGLEAGNLKLNLKNAAPGTLFALFGVFLVGVMLLQGNPELILKEVERVNALSGESSHEIVANYKGPDQIDKRLSDERGYLRLIDEARKLNHDGNSDKAIQTYSKALKLSAVSLAFAPLALDDIANIYLSRNRVEEALPLARIAVDIDGQNSEVYLHTLASVLLRTGKPEDLNDALKYAKMAVSKSQNNETFLSTLAQVKDSIKRNEHVSQ